MHEIVCFFPTSFSVMYNFYPWRSTKQVCRHLSFEEALEMYKTFACLCRGGEFKKTSELRVKFHEHLNVVICSTVLS